MLPSKILCADWCPDGDSTAIVDLVVSALQLCGTFSSDPHVVRDTIGWSVPFVDSADKYN
jgi:hypothetical protein